jgi:hypothetical protein
MISPLVGVSAQILIPAIADGTRILIMHSSRMEEFFHRNILPPEASAKKKSPQSTVRHNKRLTNPG